MSVDRAFRCRSRAHFPLASYEVTTELMLMMLAPSRGGGGQRTVW